MMKFSGERYLLKREKRPGSCPYWMGHQLLKNRLLGELLFEKWIKRPGTSYKLYWRQHPEEVAGAIDAYARSRKVNNHSSL